MYKVYVGYVQLKAFLSSMLEKDLIEYNKQDRFYTITEKGMRFLQVYNQFNSCEQQLVRLILQANSKL